MSLLQHVIWECGDDPIYELGDEHSLYIMASWFAVLDHCKVRPLLAEGITLVVDNWFYKLISRFKLKSTVDFAHVKRCFEALYRPDCIVFLDVSPTVAAHRKDVFTLAEAGNLDGLSGRTRDNFVRYQASYRDVLREFATANGSITVKVDGRSPDEITDEVVHRLRETLSETT
jgi:dTMP kinase